MPPHAVLGLLALLLSVLAALTVLLYAAVPGVRRATRWPVVALTVLSMATTAAAAGVGKTLLEAVDAVGPPAEVVAAQAHGHGSDALTTSVFFLLVATLSTVWGPLRPSRPAGGAAARWWTGILGVLAVATLVTAGIVLAEALEAVTAGNPAWQVG
ncbi:hypothetical protein [uncultured Cellulomonas sp.]|uniref:hypothetical protein n=1 Tax=uncultured Cellulomonas sp. TaxID=189682 RepID=UPI0028E83216|nr:hypothetical protein [uncultured Cellulomonas sp.]